MEEIQQWTELEKPHKIYKEMVCENTDGHDAVSKPRDVKQLYNALRKKELRLSRDAIFNTHKLAYETSFIHHITTYPDLCIVCGYQEMIDEMSSIKRLRQPEFLMSYDTTFNLGEFYVSPLVFKHIVFNE